MIRRTVPAAPVAIAALAVLATVAITEGARAEDPTYTLTIKDHKFEPSTLTVKAGEKFKLVITNAGTKAAEFESDELKREKVIAGGSSATVNVGPLKPGTYPFFDEFDSTNTGQIVAE